MKTLYVRIVITFIFISFISAVIAFFIANAYYQAKLKEHNEQKILMIAEEIRELYAHTAGIDVEQYLTHIANLNFQLYLYDESLNGTLFGESFREYEIEESKIRDVLAGNTYYGITKYSGSLFVTGFFKDDIRNSIGIPLQIDGKPMALFVRPNVEKQFGEMRIVLGLLLVLTFLFSILLIFLLTRYIVGPIRKLTKATKKIASGNYDIGLDVARSDEIGQLAKDFSLMAASLKKLDEMRQEFVSNVSHEIQSPLTSIQGFSKAIRTQQMGAEEAKHYLEIIEKESERLSSLTKQLLMLSSLDKEVKAVQKLPYRLDEQIREAVLLLEWQWQQKELNLDLDLPAIVIEADRQLLHQVWINLITNSIKFTPNGGCIMIDMVVDTEILITIRDTGIGIEEEVLPHIFERFYKGDPARNRMHAGSGLGLAVVKKIIELHDGAIEVTSQVGKGSAFILRLPIVGVN